MSRRRHMPWGLWAGCLVAAVAAHAALMIPGGRALARSLADGWEPKPIEEEEVLSLDFIEPEPAVEVEVDDANDVVPPPETRRASDRNSKVEEETKAPIGLPGAPKVAGAEPGETPKPADPVDPVEDAAGTEDLVAAADGSEAGVATTPNNVANDWGKLGGSTNMLHDTFGTSGRPDRVPDVKPGSKSLLDTKEHLFSSFFSRMRGRILEHWNAQKAIDRYDPRGTALGDIARSTAVKISIAPSGAIDKLTILSPSGVDYLDDEALRALKAAGPFPNPPEGLFEDGKFEINVVFTVQPDGSAKVFRSR